MVGWFSNATESDAVSPATAAASTVGRIVQHRAVALSPSELESAGKGRSDGRECLRPSGLVDPLRWSG